MHIRPEAFVRILVLILTAMVVVQTIRLSGPIVAIQLETADIETRVKHIEAGQTAEIENDNAQIIANQQKILSRLDECMRLHRQLAPDSTPP